MADILHYILISHHRSERFGTWCVYLFSIVISQMIIQVVSESSSYLSSPGVCEVGIWALH